MENILNIYLDIDGVLAVWLKGMPLPIVRSDGYCMNLPPTELMYWIRDHVINNRRYRFRTMSAYFDDTTALRDKNIWLDRYLPMIERKDRIFVPCGGPTKAYAVEKHIGRRLDKRDILIDDFSVNLIEWQNAGGTGIKYLNGVNGTKGSWKGPKSSDPEEMFKIIAMI